jgi:hypothetical protein
MDLKKYKRAFFFGCSFTHYYWPTWAELLSREITETHVYAQVGAGNFYIYQALVEATVKYNIGPNDLVMVMLSNATREDRYTRREGWITPGNLFFQDRYNKDFLDKFFCEKGYLMRDLSLAEGMMRILDNTGADNYVMSIVPLDSLSSDSTKMNGVDDVVNFYSNTLSRIKPNVLDTVFNGDWNSKTQRPKYTTHWASGIYTDNHPTPLEHLEYLENVFPTLMLSNATREYAETSTNELLSCKTHNDVVDKFKNQLCPIEERL